MPLLHAVKGGRTRKRDEATPAAGADSSPSDREASAATPKKKRKKGASSRKREQPRPSPEPKKAESKKPREYIAVEAPHRKKTDASRADVFHAEVLNSRL